MNYMILNSILVVVLLSGISFMLYLASGQLDYWIDTTPNEHHALTLTESIGSGDSQP